jgi:hypothetical protein
MGVSWGWFHYPNTCLEVNSIQVTPIMHMGASCV